MAASLDGHQLTAGQLGDDLAALDRADQVVVAVDRQQRRPDAGAPRPDRLGVRVGAPVLGHQHLGRGLAAPAHAVLDGLGRTRLREAHPEEEPQEVVVRRAPEVDVVLRPVLQRVGPDGRDAGRREGGRVGQSLGAPVRAARAESHGRPDQDRAEHSRLVVGGQVERPVGSPGQPHQHGAVGPGGVEHGQRVLDLPVVVVVRGIQGPVGAAVAGAVVGQDAVVACQVGHLQLPELLVDDRPGGQQQQRRSVPGRAVTVHLVVDLDPAGLDVPVGVRLAGLHRRSLWYSLAVITTSWRSPAIRSTDRPNHASIRSSDRQDPRGRRRHGSRHDDAPHRGSARATARRRLRQAVDTSGGRGGRGSAEPDPLPLRRPAGPPARGAGEREPATARPPTEHVRRGRPAVAALRPGLRLPRGGHRVGLRARAAGDDRGRLVRSGCRRQGHGDARRVVRPARGRRARCGRRSWRHSDRCPRTRSPCWPDRRFSAARRCCC